MIQFFFCGLLRFLEISSGNTGQTLYIGQKRKVKGMRKREENGRKIKIELNSP